MRQKTHLAFIAGLAVPLLAACGPGGPDSEAVTAALRDSFASAGITEVTIDTLACRSDGAPDRQLCTIGAVTMRGAMPGEAEGSLAMTIADPDVSLGRSADGVWELIDIIGGTAVPRAD